MRTVSACLLSVHRPTKMMTIKMVATKVMFSKLVATKTLVIMVMSFGEMAVLVKSSCRANSLVEKGEHAGLTNMAELLFIALHLAQT